jgi:tetratricopeptide (TPR) repeat protein
MSEKNIKEDPVKMHKDANSLMENGKFAEGKTLYVKTAELYYKGQNYFGAAEMYYKAGECDFALKEYAKAVESFMKSAQISFDKGYERYGVSALDCARDGQKALNNPQEVEVLDKKIKEVKAKLELAF